VTAYASYDSANRYYFTNLLAPCRHRYHVAGDPHDEFPGFCTN